MIGCPLFISSCLRRSRGSFSHSRGGSLGAALACCFHFLERRPQFRGYGAAREFNRQRRAIANPGDDRCLAVRRFDGCGDDLFVFIEAERKEFSCSAGGEQGGGAMGEQGGDILVESQVGVGSTFEVLLPAWSDVGGSPKGGRS